MYLLNQETKIPYKTTMENFLSYDINDNIIKRTWINNILVSTVFLNFGASYNDDVPKLFETMIFEGVHDGYQLRYKTYEEALLGHENAVKLVNDSL